MRVCRQQEPRLCIERGRERENRQRSIDRSIDVCLSVCLCDVEHIYIYICETTTTNKREYIGVCCWLGWLGWLGVWGTGHRRPPPSQTKRAKPSQATHTKWNSTLCHIHCVCVQRTNNGGYLVDPASSHMLVSKIKPCMSKYKLVYTARLRMAH